MIPPVSNSSSTGTPHSEADAPGVFNPGRIWPDEEGTPINAHGAGLLHHEGVTYWYGEHKTEGRAGNLAHVGVRVYASRDLYRWRDAGVALAVHPEAGHELAAGCIIERPKVIYNRATRRFVMWFHLEPRGAGYTGARSGVAVSDSPEGPFRYLGSFRPNAGVWPENAPTELRRPLDEAEAALLAGMKLMGGPVSYYPKQLLFRRDFAGGQMARDQTLFVDDDGSAYHVYASEENGTLHLSLLSDDYLRPAGRYVRLFPGGFHEAPALFKARGRYFLITSGCTGWAPNMARLCAAQSIWGPWEELGCPCAGPGAAIANTFGAQSSFVFPVPGRDEAFIFIADQWRPDNAIDGRYAWLPIEFCHDTPVIRWHDEWSLSFFDRPGAS